MFYYLEYHFFPGAGAPEVQVLDETTELSAPALNVLYLRPGLQRLLTLDTPGGRLLLLGDPVFQPREGLAAALTTASGQVNESVLYEEIRGHYYWFLLYEGGLCHGASFGAIYPVYYSRCTGRAAICSSAFFLAGQTDAGAPDRRNLLERLLFNYPFFNSTWWTNIRLLDAHRHLRITGKGAAIEGVFDLSRYFGDGCLDRPEDLHALTEQFENEVRLFLPEGPFAVSFTGGFDGRTLVAAAHAAGRRDFFTYSFGMPGEADVRFPAAQAKRLGIAYTPIYLDEQYVERHALEAATDFMRLTDYNGNFGRPHYAYAARLLAEKTPYIVTGNFGSELFRAMHQPGVMMSDMLVRFFSDPNGGWKDYPRQVLGEPARRYFRQELDALIADLEQYRARQTARDPNQRFYSFVFQEIFRKYFGPELVMQSHYLHNRTPYLSLSFFQALNATVWSGVHARLFEKQKSKRMKGQVFYSAFLQRMDKRFYHLKTNKGYSPADVLEPARLPLLLGRVALQKYLRQEPDDSNAVAAFFQRHRGAIARPILAQSDSVLRNAGIAALLETTPEPDQLEQTIKLYSIAAGWSAAAAVHPATAPFNPASPHPSFIL